MDIFENFGLYFVRAFALLAQWLTALTSPIPWPLVMALVAVPLLFIANFVVWFLRGVVWPVRCKYPDTTVRHGADSACRNWVTGEWKYCHHHNNAAASKKSTIVPFLPRWKTTKKDANGEYIDRKDIRGSSSSISFFFYRGFARSPGQIIDKALPDMWQNLKKNLRIVMNRFKKEDVTQLSTAGIQGYTPTEAERENYIAIGKIAVRTDEALSILKWGLPIAFIVTAATIFIKGPWTVPLQYFALLLLWIVIEIIRCGLLKRYNRMDESWFWLINVIKGTLKAFFIMVGVALICLALDQYIMPFLEKLLATHP